jgi:phosphoenolpyruvate-protein phosphotransferase (PTS system enzyme I)
MDNSGPNNSGQEQRFHGIGVSPGIVTGKIFIYGRNEVPVSHRTITPDEVPGEIQKLEKALAATKNQIQEIKHRVAADLGEMDAVLFDAHMLVLEDPLLIDEVVKMIKDGSNVEMAFESISNRYAKTLSMVSDDYLKERAADIKDVAHRVLRNLQGHDFLDLRDLSEPCIVISYDLSPSDTAMMEKRKVIAFGTDIGSKTSHTAIMARAMDIPALVGLHNASQLVESGTPALLDGYSGTLIINPTEQTLYEYGQIESKRHSIEVSLETLRDLPAETLDQHRVHLAANIEMPDDVSQVIMNGADGVGLYRTEYIFISRDDIPTEEQQFKAYFEVAEKLHPRPVVIRTLDLGGDKFLSHLQIPAEMNPFLGWRAIRFCLERSDIFRTQLRAILRASVLGNVRIMYPLISGVHELRAANQELEKAKQELRDEKVYFDEHLQVGTMIEVPSAAVTADILAKECSFFSIGTNDLIQYALAVDRVNEKIAHLYEPTHPAIIRLLHHIVDSGHQANIKVSVCGEMASDVALLPLLLGLGVDDLSTSPNVVPQLKKIVRSMNLSQAQEIARHALELSDSAEIRRISTDFVRSIAADVLELSSQ